MQKIHRIFIALVMLYAILSPVEGIVCTKNFCETVKCRQETCNGENQTLQRGGLCGCCFVCYTVLREGEICGSPVALLGGPPSSRICAEKLICFQNKCQKEEDVVSKISAER